jgi:dTDP-4-amino-4,6-dideoxygalactose transaminase
MEVDSLIRLSKSVVGEEEIKAVQGVLSRGYLGMGREVQAFENDLSLFFSRPATCVNTGTAALQLAMQAVGITRGDEVLVQSLTYVASFQAITATGATPIACEVDDRTLTIDLVDAQNKLSSRTKAIMPVHYAGNPGPLSKIYTFANENKLRVIEDAAHSFGTKYNDRLIGSFGDIVCFSFDGIKNITSGEGGVVITEDPQVTQAISDARLLGVEKDTENRYVGDRSWDFDVVQQGWRYHMSNIMASIGSVQLKKFEHFKKSRQEIAQYYDSLLSRYVNVSESDYTQIVPHIYVIRIAPGQRDRIRTELLKNGIQTGIHYKPNHMLSKYSSNQDCSTLIRTENIYDSIITLPLHPDITLQQVKFICKKLKELL